MAHEPLIGAIKHLLQAKLKASDVFIVGERVNPIAISSALLLTSISSVTGLEI